MYKKTQLTQQGFNKFKKELEDLQSQMPGMALEVNKMAAMGDRSENAGYSYAKMLLRKTQGRIRYLEKLLRNSKILEKSTSNKIQLGSRVVIKDIISKEKYTYTVVNTLEVDLKQGYISDKSPIGKALLEKKAGEEIEIKIGENFFKYSILSIN